MKITTVITLTLLLTLLSACIKDKSKVTYTLSRPEYAVRDGVKTNARLQKPEAIKNPGSFVLYNTTMYVNEKNKGIHVIDCLNPANPVNKGFIPIPGNTGLAIKNNLLYADCYCDLFVFTIPSSGDIQLQSDVKNTFVTRMGYGSYDSNYVRLTWIKKDTTVSQEYYNQHVSGGLSSYGEDGILYNAQSTSPANLPNGASVGSSMAMFTIVGDYLYTVDQSNLNTFSIQNPLYPLRTAEQHVNWNVETIFPFKDKLFIGSMSGMFIFSLSNPANPSYLSQFNHVRVCDPVIADDKFALVTLRNGTQCGGFVNQLDVLNIEDISAPVLLKSFPFTNSHGLSKDGHVLFVCDGAAGLKVVDATNMNDLKTRHTLAIGKAIDVVAYRQKAFVMLDDAIRIYAYDQQFNVTLLGSLTKN